MTTPSRSKSSRESCTLQRFAAMSVVTRVKNRSTEPYSLFVRHLRSRMKRIPRPLGTLAFLLAWLVPWRPAFRIRAKQSKLSFFVQRRDLLGRHLAKYGTHEQPLTQWMSDYLAASSHGGIFIDVGANLGWHTVQAAQQHGGGRDRFRTRHVQCVAARSQPDLERYRQS